ncbi:MAG: hypothetical protein U1D69_11790 [Polynucleobacter sp.]|uniref:hypothetical protein n=1 Tax=Limnobacter sp. TaxID=2003368 RepID=UPI00273640A9|nr:hypothetical protein [Limnobacter sp.]MDP3271384.1 hypothetical protein [Limnobacter sp.]MDZ4057618.1 hypothetical protein [Polynucleobacter sp.]
MNHPICENNNIRTFASILFIALVACSNNSEPQAIQGEWAIHKELAAAPIVGISDEETAGLIGGKLSISDKSIQFQDQTCEYSRVESNKQNLSEFLQIYSLDTNARLPEKTSVLSMDCEGEMTIRHMLTGEDKLWLVWYGVLLEADRI